MRTDSVDLNIPVIQRPRTEEVRGRDRSLVPAGLAVFGGLVLLAVLLQTLSGAYHAEFSAYPDEPAHYVTSLMLREYITGPSPLSPLKFAEEYYRHYPKVAFGHWPPFFYVVQAVWMMLFTAARASVRLEVAVTTALLGFSLWFEARRWFGQWAALLGAALLVCVPLVQESTDQEMAETLLALCCFWSTIYFGRFLDTRKLRDALFFGLYFALAVLTKGSGWLLFFVPVIGMLLTRKARLVWTKEFWLGLALAAALCVPWQLATLHSAQRGWAGGSQPSVGYTLSALAEFFTVTVSILGPIFSVLVGIGIVVMVGAPLVRGRVQTAPAVLFALLAGDWVFHSLVPAGVEDRKMIMAVPALIYFVLAGGRWLADRIPAPVGWAAWKRPAMAVLAGVVFCTTVFSIPRDSHYGYSEAARFVVADPALRSGAVLVSSGSIGEGLLISEVAMLEPRPKGVILRATKELASMDWTGGHYKSVYNDESSLMRYLDQAKVKSIVVDTYQGADLFPHTRLVKQILKEDGGKFRLRAEFGGRSDTGQAGLVKVYERRGE